MVSEVSHEHIARIPVARISSPIRPSLVIAVGSVAVGLFVAIGPGTASQPKPLIVAIAVTLVAIPRIVRVVVWTMVVGVTDVLAMARLSPVVIVIVAARVVVAITRVVAPSSVVKHGRLR